MSSLRDYVNYAQKPYSESLLLGVHETENVR